MTTRRPLPTPPGPAMAQGYKYSQYTLSRQPPAGSFLPNSPFSSPSYAPDNAAYDDHPTSTISSSTILHKGFYDLLAMIPTPSPSRLLWGPAEPAALTSPPPDAVVLAGPRYEEIPPRQPYAEPPRPLSPPAKRGRRISKDMVSKPTGFVHLVHASDADQYEALLTRWGPDGLGKLGDPRWATPIKNKIRQLNLFRNAEANKTRSSQLTVDAGALGPLHVVNGVSTLTGTSSNMTTAAQENAPSSLPVDGLPGRPGRSTIRWGGGLMAPHAEVQEHEDLEAEVEQAVVYEPPPPRAINPSLATLEKAVAARIYFENLYFPLLRQAPSREQRRLAMEKDMAEMQLPQAHREQLRARWVQNETTYLREQRRKVDVTAFIKLRTIGHGAFGVVSLVKERNTGKFYAMKELRKADMLRKGQEGHVRAERDILKSASLVSSPGGAEWIVKMHYSFQDRDHLYLVLEFMGGGDLLNLLIERDVFEEDFTRFYVAEMVLAIESCHKHGFIHRDIKPDNFLFDPDGHIRLSDFGLATDLHWAHDTSYYEQQRKHLLHKHGIDLTDSIGMSNGKGTQRLNSKQLENLMGGENGEGVFTWREKNRRKLAYSVCGTNSYMSPEVIRGHGYSYSCDWWSLGVIMFECLYGFPPFVSNSRHITRQKILNWKQTLKFPPRPRVSREGVKLMQQLLCEPEDRLGSQALSSVSRPDSMIVNARRSGFVGQSGSGTSIDGAEHIKAHPFFAGIDWSNIHKYEAPYRPDLRNPEDTRHFDSDIPAEPLAPANGAPADATKDPLLRDKIHGAEILDMRKALAFAGFTHRSPRTATYVRADNAFAMQDGPSGRDDSRGRSTVRGSTLEVGRGRAISL